MPARANQALALVVLQDSTPLYQVSGTLSPEGDTGASQTDGITSDTTPTYSGTANPEVTIQVLVSTADAAGVVVGQTTADANGNWQVTSRPLGDGNYTVWAITSLPGVMQGSPVILGKLVIDTVGPRVTGVVLDHASGKIVLTIEDSLAGMDPASVLSPACYSVTRFLTPKLNERVKNHVTAVSMNTTTSPSGTCVVTLELDHGRQVTHARFLVQVSAAGIVDLAGNHLLGGFTGKFLTGSSQVARNFAGRLDYYHHKAFPVRSVKPRYQIMRGSMPKGHAGADGQGSAVYAHIGRE